MAVTSPVRIRAGAKLQLRNYHNLVRNILLPSHKILFFIFFFIERSGEWWYIGGFQVEPQGESRRAVLHSIPTRLVFRLDPCAVSSVVERSIAARRVSGSNPELRLVCTFVCMPLLPNPPSLAQLVERQTVVCVTQQISVGHWFDSGSSECVLSATHQYAKG